MILDIRALVSALPHDGLKLFGAKTEKHLTEQRQRCAILNGNETSRFHRGYWLNSDYVTAQKTYENANHAAVVELGSIQQSQQGPVTIQSKIRPCNLKIHKLGSVRASKTLKTKFYHYLTIDCSA
jgi:hypothetical protein